MDAGLPASGLMAETVPGLESERLPDHNMWWISGHLLPVSEVYRPGPSERSPFHTGSGGMCSISWGRSRWSTYRWVVVTDACPSSFDTASRDTPPRSARSA